MQRPMIQMAAGLMLALMAWTAHAQSPASRPANAQGADGRPSAATAVSATLLPWRQIEGLWDEQVVQVDCITGATLHPIGRGTNLFVAGGFLIATNNAPPTVMGVTLGQWWYGRDRKFHVKMRLNLFQPPSEMFLGIREIERTITLSENGNHLDGVVQAQDYYPDGTLNGAQICATETGVRVAAP